MNKFKLIFIFVFFIFNHSYSYASLKEKMCSINSPNNTVALIEMYTSEACSSCPPGDRAIAALPNINFPTEKVAVLAFHVDYWDHLDWIDPYSKPEYVQRHKLLATKNNAKALFTPHFFVNSKEVFNWRANLVKETHIVNQKKSIVDINLDYEIANNKLMIDLDTSKDKYDWYVAVSENKILRKITDGENSGKVINYHHVVKELVKLDKIKKTHEIMLKNDWNKQNLSMVVFAQNNNSEVMQSVFDDKIIDCVVKL